MGSPFPSWFPRSARGILPRSSQLRIHFLFSLAYQTGGDLGAVAGSVLSTTRPSSPCTSFRKHLLMNQERVLGVIQADRQITTAPEPAFYRSPRPGCLTLPSGHPSDSSLSSALVPRITTGHQRVNGAAICSNKKKKIQGNFNKNTTLPGFGLITSAIQGRRGNEHFQVLISQQRAPLAPRMQTQRNRKTQSKAAPAPRKGRECAWRHANQV